MLARYGAAQGWLDVAAPVIGEKQVRTTVVFRLSLRKKL
jgi:hypothetical protein